MARYGSTLKIYQHSESQIQGQPVLQNRIDLKNNKQDVAAHNFTPNPKQRHMDLCEFKSSLDYRASFLVN